MRASFRPLAAKLRGGQIQGNGPKRVGKRLQLSLSDDSFEAGVHGPLNGRGSEGFLRLLQERKIYVNRRFHESSILILDHTQSYSKPIWYGRISMAVNGVLCGI
jgi:hypothetical protein